MTETQRVADVIARRLAEAGCRHAFGIPGGEVLTILDALDKAGIEFVLTKHEMGAGFMAEGAYQVTGAPGVLLATVGPGAANALNAVANADQDRVPLIVLTGCVEHHEALHYTHQIFDHAEMFRPFVKASLRAEAKGANLLADKAVALAMADRPGPVHIDVPIATATAPAELIAFHPEVRTSPAAPAAGPDLEAARTALAEAERPLILAGWDAVRHEAGPDLLALAEALEAPILTTYKAKGLVAEDHPLSLGAIGLSPAADKAIVPLMQSADTLLLAGYDAIEMRVGWREVWDPARQAVIELTPLQDLHYMHQARWRFLCDTAAGARALMPGQASAGRWSNGAPQAVKGELAATFKLGEDWGPTALVEAANAALPPDTQATVDSGAHRILLDQVWVSRRPRGVLQSNGLCTMGCALPLAIGAKLADPTKPVAAFMGDAGLEMILGELATLRDLKLALPVVVFVDTSLALIELKQRQRDLGNVGVDFPGTDFVALGEAMGGRGVEVADRTSLETALREAMTADTFTLIACRLPRKAYDGRL